MEFQSNENSPSDSALTIAIGANNQQVLWMLPNESQLDEEGVAIVRLVVAARCGNGKSTAVRFSIGFF